MKPADVVRTRERFREIVARGLARAEEQMAEEMAALRPFIDGRGRRKRAARREPEERDE